MGIIDNIRKFIVVLSLVLISVIASDAQVKIKGIHPTPLYPRQENPSELKQLVRLTLDNKSFTRNCVLEAVFEDGEAYSQIIPDVTEGVNVYDVLLPDIDKRKEVVFRVLSSGVIMDEYNEIWEPQKKWKIYYAAVSHQDLGFETYYQNIRRVVREGAIDQALEYCRLTDEWEDDAKFRWNIETSEPIIRWINKRSSDKVAELVRRINEGRIELGAVHNTISSQMAGYEVLARSFYTPNRYVSDLLDIEPAKVAIINDVTGITRSWPLFSKEAGVPYLMHGSNAPNCLQDLYDFPVFYWKSTDDSSEHILCRADSYYSQNKLSRWDESDMEELIARNNRPDWAYDCILAYDSHDFALPTMDNSKKIKEWNSKYVYPKVRCSLISSFFDDIASQSWKANIYETDKDAPDSWDDQDATDAELLSLARRTSTDLPTAEKYASFAMNQVGGYPDDDIYEAYNGLIMYHEHTNGAISGGDHQYYETEKQMHRQLVKESAEFTKNVKDSSLAALSAIVKTKDDAVIVYNPLSWQRSDIVEVPAELYQVEGNISLLDSDSGLRLDIQELQDGRKIFLATDIPGTGYKTYYIQRGAGRTEKSTLSDEKVLENKFYTVTIDRERNIISSIFDKALQKEIIDNRSEYALGEYVYYDHWNKKYNHAEFTGITYYKGNVADEIHITQKAPLAKDIELVVYIYHDVKKLDFSLELDKLSNQEPLVGSWVRNMLEAAFCAIPVKVPEFLHTHELAGTVTEPGNINKQLESAESAYYAIQHFADASNQDFGVTVSTIDAALVEYGHPRPGMWESTGRKYKEPVVKPENSNMFLYLMNNFFQTNICVDQPGYKRFEFSIRSHSGNWKTGEAYKFGWETSHPLDAVFAIRNRKGHLPDCYSFIDINADNVVCSTIKPAEFNGKGFVLRFFELSGNDTDINIKLNFMDKLEKATSLSLIEEYKNNLAFSDNKVFFTIPGNGIVTLGVCSRNAAPVKISGLTAKGVSDTSVELSWSLDDKNISHCRIFRSENPECPPDRINYIGSVHGKEYNDSPELHFAGWQSNIITPGKTYYYRVCPVDKNNNPGILSDPVEVNTLKRNAENNDIPEKVKGLFAVHVSPLAPEDYVNIVFYTNIEDDIFEYEVYRSTIPGFVPKESDIIGNVCPSEMTLDYRGEYSYSELERQMYQDRTAKPGIVYYYKVCAVDRSGQRGPFSEEVSIMMKEKPVKIDVDAVSSDDFLTSSGNVIVTLTSDNGDLYYTLDGSIPMLDSKHYDKPFIIQNDALVNAGLFINDSLVYNRRLLVKSLKAIAQSEFGQTWNASMSADGNTDIGSQWVSARYGGGTKENPDSVWLQVFLPERRNVSGVEIYGDYRDIMPEQKEMYVYGRNDGKMSLMGTLTSDGEKMDKRNHYKISFPSPVELDALMLMVPPSDIPASSDPEQDGLVRICEVKILSE